MSKIHGSSMWLALCATLVALPGVLTAAELAKPLAGIVEVEMFAAMKSGEIEVKFIPKNEKEARVVIKNLTQQPLNVRLPAVFAGVPVLAQNANAFPVNGFPDFGNNKRSSAKNTQGVGGGFNLNGGLLAGGQPAGAQNGGGQNGLGQLLKGNGFFNVTPEKVGVIRVSTVCLEHGKRTPYAAIPYEIRPLESFNSDPQVRELLKLFARDEVEQRVAQAAAWHVANGMSWDDLAAKRGEEEEKLVGPATHRFSKQDIADARRLVDKAIAEAKRSPQTASTGSPSQSQSR